MIEMGKKKKKPNNLYFWISVLVMLSIKFVFF